LKVKNVEVLGVQGVCFTYGSEVILDDVTFSLEEGDALALVGPNGSGKTTLIQLILGLLRPVQGQIRLFGTDVKEFRAWYRIGYVPQKAVLDVRFPTTVREVVAAGRFGRVGLGHRLQHDDWQVVEDAIDMVGLLSLQNYPLMELSGGQQQRAFIARALAGEPEMLILDEPQTGLDDRKLHDFYQLLQYLNQEKKITVLMVTHDIEMVGSWASKVAFLNRRLISYGSPREVLHPLELNHYEAGIHSKIC
jgi:zinc transport system ATP-binding protein